MSCTTMPNIFRMKLHGRLMFFDSKKEEKFSRVRSQEIATTLGDPENTLGSAAGARIV